MNARDFGSSVARQIQLLASIVGCVILIGTFGIQVVSVEGLSMAPTINDRDRLIVDEVEYELGNPRPGDIVMLYYPLNPQELFIKRLIAKEGDTVRVERGYVYVNEQRLRDDYIPAPFRSHEDWGPQRVVEWATYRPRRPPEQQLGQPRVGPRAEALHRRQGEN